MAAAYNNQMPEDSLGNHVVLIVKLHGTDWLCDLGLGDALRSPVVLREGQHQDGPLLFRLESLAGSTDRCNTLGELLRWRLIEQGLSRTLVELPGDSIELGLAV